MVKHFIFDLGNVILNQKINFGGDYFADIIDRPREEIYDFYRKNKRNLIAGDMSFYAVLALAIKTFGVEMSVEEMYSKLKANYVKDVVGVDEEMINIIGNLGKTHPIYVMTNTIEPHYEYWVTLGLNKYFKRIFRSDTDHFMKPEKKAYEFVVNEISATPEECVFVDDLEKNVRSAETIGIKGIVYRNPVQLRADLEKIGVKI